MCTDLPTFRALIASRLGVTVFRILRCYIVFVYNPSSTEHTFYLTVHPTSFIYIRVIKKDASCRHDLQSVSFRICVKAHVLICSRVSCWLLTGQKLEQKRDAFAVPRNGTRDQQQSTQLPSYLRVEQEIHLKHKIIWYDDWATGLTIERSEFDSEKSLSFLCHIQSGSGIHIFPSKKYRG